MEEKGAINQSQYSEEKIPVTCTSCIIYLSTNSPCSPTACLVCHTSLYYLQQFTFCPQNFVTVLHMYNIYIYVVLNNFFTVAYYSFCFLTQLVVFFIVIIVVKNNSDSLKSLKFSISQALLFISQQPFKKISCNSYSQRFMRGQTGLSTLTRQQKSMLFQVWVENEGFLF